MAYLRLQRSFPFVVVEQGRGVIVPEKGVAFDGQKIGNRHLGVSLHQQIVLKTLVEPAILLLPQTIDGFGRIELKGLPDDKGGAPGVFHRGKLCAPWLFLQQYVPRIGVGEPDHVIGSVEVGEDIGGFEQDMSPICPDIRLGASRFADDGETLTTDRIAHRVFQHPDRSGAVAGYLGADRIVHRRKAKWDTGIILCEYPAGAKETCQKKALFHELNVTWTI